MFSFINQQGVDMLIYTFLTNPNYGHIQLFDLHSRLYILSMSECVLFLYFGSNAVF